MRPEYNKLSLSNLVNKQIIIYGYNNIRELASYISVATPPDEEDVKKMNKNKHLNKAKNLKNDEFYTRIQTIERELTHYSKHFKGKIVYCNCDDYKDSNFFAYFKNNFDHLNLKKLIATNYSQQGGEKATYDGQQLFVEALNGNGDFRNEENIKILKEVDIIVTNPPFSLFREYIAQLIEYNKDFITLGNINAVTYVDIFPHIRDGKILTGVNFDVSEEFTVPDSYKGIVKTTINDEGLLVSKIQNIAWYTSLKHNIEKRMELTKNFNKNTYEEYDNYDAIEVSKIGNIPKNYDGVMGVPVNFLKDYCPSQFKIVGSNRGRKQDSEGYYGRSTYIDGKETYKRIFIKHKD